MRHLLASAMAISLLAGSLAPALAADSRSDSDRRHERRLDHRAHDRSRADHRRDYRSDHRRFDNRRYEGRRYSDGRRYYPFYGPGFRYGYSSPRRFYGGAYFRPYGYRYSSWRRGDYLPGAYYAPRYILRDYRAYRLYAPPRGYRWVRVGNDVVLAALASGLVVSVVSNLFY